MAIITEPRSDWPITPSLPSRAAEPAIWHADTPDLLAVHCPWREDTGGWAAWAAHLRQRRRPREICRLFKSRRSPLGWSLTADSGPETAGLIAQLDHSGKKSARRLDALDIERWLADTDAAPRSAAAALEHLAWCWSLPWLAQQVAAETWWRLLEHLLRTSEEACQIDPDEHLLTHQLAAGELSLTLARQFPELLSCRARAAAGGRALAQGLTELVDEHGLTDPRHVELLRPLLGCWTRSRRIATPGGQDATGADEGYDAALLQAMRLTRHDGAQMLTAEPAAKRNAELFQVALDSGVPADFVHIAAECLPPLDVPRRKRRRKRLPSPACGSEPARLAVLRSDWSRRSEMLAVRYAGQSVNMELNIGRQQLWAGAWELSIRAGGQPLSPRTNWEEVCWFSDEDVDYLEIESRLGGDVRVQRQFLLARRDRILLLADAVLGTAPQSWEYRAAVPLSPGVTFLPADETREGRIAAGKQQALALPLALPEWRSASRGGTLALVDGRLELSQEASGRALYAPLLFDLDRGRRKRPFTWRRLTVADDRANRPADVACGYRVQIGNEQWLIYRSLAARRARTLLGHHVSTEFLLGRFNRRGEVRQLLEVE